MVQQIPSLGLVFTLRKQLCKEQKKKNTLLHRHVLTAAARRHAICDNANMVTNKVRLCLHLSQLLAVLPDATSQTNHCKVSDDCVTPIPQQTEVAERNRFYKKIFNL